MDRFFGEQSAENEKKVIFLQKMREKMKHMGVTARKIKFWSFIEFLGLFLWKKSTVFRQFLPELNFYITIYIFGKLKSGESFVILGPKLRVLSLKHGIYVLRTQELLLTKN